MTITGLFIRATHYPAGTRTTYALICAAIAATGSSARGDWTQFRYDPAHHGVNPNETILSPKNVGELTAKWRVAVGGWGAASARVIDDPRFVVWDVVKRARGKIFLYGLNTDTELR